MYKKLSADLEKQKEILNDASATAINFLENINDKPVNTAIPDDGLIRLLPEAGLGADGALDLFKKEYLPYVPASTGPRYYGYVIGGVTPAALAGDWLTSAIDQNAFGFTGTVDERIEEEAIGMVIDLLGLPLGYSGVFVSGATTSAFNAMCMARQWAAMKDNKNACVDSLYGLKAPEIISGQLHGANVKAMSMAGLGRNYTKIDLVPNRECIDIDKLKEYLKTRDSDRPMIIVANMGTASSGDLDNLSEIAALKETYDFWLHVDGAFGVALASVNEFKDMFKGLGKADSITMDTHKWLNVPYDGAVILTTHSDLQYMCFTNTSDVTPPADEIYPHYHLTPEGSRRLRALPAWMSLMAYGKEGHADIVKQDYLCAQRFADLVRASDIFHMNNQVRVNQASFSLNISSEYITEELMKEILKEVEKTGITYSNYVPFLGKPALRVCITNWRTSFDDIDKAFEAFENAAYTVVNRKGYKVEVL